MGGQREPISGKKLLSYIALFILGGLVVVYLSGHYANLPESIRLEGFLVSFEHLKESLLTKPLSFRPLNMEITKQWLTIAGGVSGIAALFIFNSPKENVRRGIEYGSARWMKNKDRTKFTKAYTNSKKENEKLKETGAGNSILSQNTKLSNDGRKTRLNNNEVVIGGSGTGKSRFYVKPNLLEANGSYIVTDPAGELLHDTGKFLESQGYKVKVFNIVEMDKSSGYNPFNYVKSEEDVMRMIDTLITNTDEEGSSKGDGFWRSTERNLLVSLASYLIEVYPVTEGMNEEERDHNKRMQSFPEILNLLGKEKVVEDENDDPSELEMLMNDLELSNPKSLAVRMYKDFKEAAPKTAMSILATVRTRMAPFSTSKILRDMMRFDEMDLGRVGDEKTALFIVIPVANKTYNFLASMLYTQLFETLYYKAETEYNGGMLPIQVNFYLDEFANIGKIPEFPEKLATVRKYGINVKIILQSLSQIKAMYKDDWEGLLDNCDTLIYLGGNSPTTFEYISKRLGKQTITQTTSSRSYSKSDSRSANKGLLGRELLTPDEVGMLDNLKSIVIIRTILPILDSKYDYPKHPNYKYTADNDDKNSYFKERRLFEEMPEPPQEVPVKKFSFMSEFKQPEVKVFNDVLLEDILEQTKKEAYYIKSSEFKDISDVELYNLEFKEFIENLESGMI